MPFWITAYAFSPMTQIGDREVMNTTIDSWEINLSALVASTLDAYGSQFEDEIELFAVDCHPWNGILVLAILTVAEAESNPELNDTAEMAAWKYYDFASELAEWEPASKLSSSMREAYDRAETDRSVVADQFLRACAAAVRTAVVQEALTKYSLADTFRISVSHPDTGQEYVTT